VNPIPSYDQENTMNWTENDVLTNGIRLHYYRSGGDKPAIVMTHGITDSGLCWPLVAPALVEDYDLIAVDARGHGKSEKPDSGYSRDEHARDIAGLIEALDLGNPAMIGHSMGSATAAQVAANYPEMLTAVVLEDPPWRDENGPSVARASADERRRQIEERKALSQEEFLQLGKLENPNWREEEFEPWIESKYAVSPNVINFVGGARMTWQGVADKIRCPALVITGDTHLGAIVSPEVAVQVKAANPCIEVVHIPGAGHNIRREQLDAYLQAVKEFLARVYPPS
jgi:pimeloyl-ACP methyl ester carboxylesterase